MAIPVAAIVEGVCAVHMWPLAAAEGIRALQVNGHAGAGAAAASACGRG